MMKYYKSPDGEVFSYSADGSDDSYIKEGLILMNAAEVSAHLNPAPAPPPVPQSVTMRQARQAMLYSGILGQVDALIAAMPGEEGESARIDWAHARDVKREWPLIAALGPQLGLTKQQVDDLFVYAGSIPQ